MAELCTMCEEAPATVADKWPGPVCSSCDRYLDGIHADLTEMERNDPLLAELGREAEDAAQAVVDAVRAQEATDV